MLEPVIRHLQRMLENVKEEGTNCIRQVKEDSFCIEVIERVSFGIIYCLVVSVQALVAAKTIGIPVRCSKTCPYEGHKNKFMKRTWQNA